jgi:CPA2 family monovalent cation:H+ antiporter-2
MKRPVFFANASDAGMLERCGLAKAKVLVVTMDDRTAVSGVVRTARALRADLAIVARARDTDHAAAMYRAGASHAVPETLESSLQLSEAVLVDIGVAMGPVIASIHAKRDEYREQLEREGGLSEKPRLKTASLRPDSTSLQEG